MSTAVLEPKRWTRLRWARAIGLIFAVQVGLIFCLSERQAVKARLPHTSPNIHLADVGLTDFLRLTDPTLFALPHRNGFSGKAWLEPPPLPVPSLDWSEPTNWLPLAVQELGAVFKQFTQTNNSASSSFLTLPSPAPKLPTISFLNSAPSQSILRIEGALAGRKLLSPLELRAWPRADLLTNSIVQLVVDRDGHPASVPILLTSSGDKEADEQALEQARAARFEPSSEHQTSKPPMAELTWGRLIFDWSIVPVASTNAPATAPMP